MKHSHPYSNKRSGTTQLVLLALLIIVAAVGYRYRSVIIPYAKSYVRFVRQELGLSPCAKPLTYSLGTFDAQFGISKSSFLNAMAEAEAIWEQPWGHELFQYQESGGDVTVNLVYDYRQQATDTLRKLGLTVKNTQTSYDQLKLKYDALQAEYNRARSVFDARVATFETRQRAFAETVDYWNDRGGAPRKEYEALKAEQGALNAEQETLQTMQARVNELVAGINAVAVALNKLVDALKLSVNKYNAVGSSRGESFTEGLYERTGGDARIEIYEFSSRLRLVKVLAHELGHALRLEHVEDPNAVMYSLNQGDNLNATPADLATLRTQCGT